MDEQMEMAFGDEGERVDPVSGNEVPSRFHFQKKYGMTSLLN